MDENTKKAFFVNAVVMAKADGSIDPVEKQFIKKLMEKAGISGKLAYEWLAETRKNEYRILPVTDRNEIARLIKLMIGVAAIDEKFQAQEKKILIQIGKESGLSQKELVNLIKENWNRDVIEDIFCSDPPEDVQSNHVTIVTNDFDDLKEFIQMNAGIDFNELSMTELSPSDPTGFVVFHAAEDKKNSLKRQRKIQNIFPDSKTIAVVRRHQAFQISYILDQGAFRCMVKPIYPNELNELLRKSENRT